MDHDLENVIRQALADARGAGRDSLIGQAFLRAAPHLAQPRPPGMGVEEGRELSEIAVALGPRQLQPCEELTQ